MNRLRLLLASVFLAGCFNPDDIFPVHGTVSSADPVEGQVVRLLRDTKPALGPTCTDAQPFKETTVDAEGKFSFDVFRAQAMKLTGGSVFCFRVETTFASGTTVSTELLAIGGDEALPDFPDWRARPTRTDGVLHFEPVRPLPELESYEGDQLVHRAEWRTADGGVAWAADDRIVSLATNETNLVPTRAPLLMDDLALEDFAGVVVLRGRLTVIPDETNAFGNRNVHTLELQSGDTLALAGQRTPFSRGLDCLPFASPCPLTDGALTPVDGGLISSRNSIFTWALPSPTPLSGLVIRGLETEAALMGVQLLDADGGTIALEQHELPISLWNASVPSFLVRPRADGGLDFSPSSEPRFVSIALDAGVSVSSVRVGFAGQVDALSEISLFE